ncbi:serine hydrolase domain-containing protein [Massilia sp. CMS3.1]|uniref:serine hydrolase domain-containing protein n=1 Tax=Massilia sp. CMS3.1 TaxID=3373083 RepID=UPI003EE7E98E
MFERPASRMFVTAVLVPLLLLGFTRTDNARAAIAAGQNNLPTPLQAEMTRHLQSEKLNGAVWTLVTPDAGIVTGAAGVQHAVTGQAMTPTTRVHVGSVAKTVLAIGVLRLVTTGKLTLDTDLATLLPTVQLNNPWAATDPIRVRHLLEHTAGVENFRFFQMFTLRAGADTPLSAALGESPLNISSRPGARYAYSNMSYHLLGMVIEAVTQNRYESHLDAELLRPLGMGDSTFAFTVQAGPDADPRLAMGHFENDVAHPAVPIYARPPVQFTTTAADMGRLAQFLMSDGTVEGRPFIAPAILGLLSGAHGTDAARAGLPVGHGLALATRDRHQVIGDCHPGTSVGFRAMFCLYPHERKAFFVAVNADVEEADYDKLNKPLIGALRLAPPLVRRVEASAPAGMADWTGIYVPAWNAVASLAWVDIVLNAVDVRWDGALLQLAPLQGKHASLLPAGGMLFQAGGRIAPSHVLFVSNGERMLSDGLRTYRNVSLAKMLWLWTSAALGAIGLLYVLFRGGWLLARGRLRSSSTLAVPLVSVLMLFAPLPFFFSQPFLAMGDLSMASGLLALASCALPLGIAYGLVWLLMRRGTIRQPAFDCAALLAVAQWTIVLAAWGMLPFIMWR